MKPHNPLTDPPLLKGKLSMKCSACGKSVDQAMQFRNRGDANSMALTYQDTVTLHECEQGQVGLLKFAAVVWETPKPETKTEKKD